MERKSVRQNLLLAAHKPMVSKLPLAGFFPRRSVPIRQNRLPIDPMSCSQVPDFALSLCFAQMTTLAPCLTQWAGPHHSYRRKTAYRAV